MEGDAKGQVGGMDMPAKERERLALESRTWRCHGCGGRTNETILKEEGGDPDKGKQSEPVVPEELTFGFKDQMGKPEEKTTSESKDTRTEDKIISTAKEAVPSGPVPSVSIPPSSSAPGGASLSTRADTSNPPLRQLQQTAPSMQQVQSNGVPRWVDNAITGLVAALVLMVFKKIVV